MEYSNEHIRACGLARRFIMAHVTSKLPLPYDTRTCWTQSHALHAAGCRTACLWACCFWWQQCGLTLARRSCRVPALADKISTLLQSRLELEAAELEASPEPEASPVRSLPHERYERPLPGRRSASADAEASDVDDDNARDTAQPPPAKSKPKKSDRYFFRHACALTSGACQSAYVDG